MMPSSLTYGLELDCPGLKCCSAILGDICENYLQISITNHHIPSITLAGWPIAIFAVKQGLMTGFWCICLASVCHSESFNSQCNFCAFFSDSLGIEAQGKSSDQPQLSQRKEYRCLETVSNYTSEFY